MKNRKHVLFSLAALGLVAFSAPASATGLSSVATDKEIQQCVAAIGDSADYDGAVRVEHAVLSEKRRIGYELTIDTIVYSDIDGEVIREYATTCVPTLGDAPRRFEIQRTNEGA